MRLLDVRTKQLVDRKLFDSARTRYAILSHRWQDPELTLQDLAAAKGHDHLWIYTAGGRPSAAPLAEIGASEWFRRGWTLQELLAPKTVEFYDTDWLFVGTRTSLQRAISEASSIPRRFLSGESHIRSASVAQRMVWAATRQTTRLEDQAYSLMGLFDMRVPVIRGSQENVRIALLNCRNVDDDKHSVMGLLTARQHAAAEWHRARPVIAPAGGSDDPVFVVPWEVAQYAEYETLETLSTSTWHSALQFPTPNIGGKCGSITLQLADNLPERLHAVTPRGRFRQADRFVLPAFDDSGRWQEVTLFFGPKWSQDVEPEAERGFAVVMRRAASARRFGPWPGTLRPSFANLHVQSALHQSHGQYVLEIRPGTPPSLITSVHDVFFRTSPIYRTAIAIFLVQLYVHARTPSSETWSSNLVFLLGQVYFCCAAYWQNSWLSNRMQLGRLRLLAFRPMNILQHLIPIGGWPGVDDVLQHWVWLSSHCLAFLLLFKSQKALESMGGPAF
ncbi:uncharacterized protein VDAG_04681 [Verticillium dahliae VdLs.17]|uniref:Heterokaryon incompatibility domain-containing protein n=1 Tax=Verticillium dahliae (strain VdLs.17 / ATCC MYA-4575 / FGSC 10137) TaxID=498257 RepID=G2X3U4_VERDV|nr:uncharacterized protein VDAG_04681 [Verticillium dahliae VdLs.17]EGY23243.1 hypothetical protein VDAG_04681 [Verticillium dahliae VdLs.17]